jgi:UDP-N-acetylmuramoyl-tripeptide--D-alanyl-D-alanine ligase
MLRNVVIIALASAVNIGWMTGRAVKALHMLQLDNYANDHFGHWLIEHPSRRIVEPLSGLCHLVFIAASILLPPLGVNAALVLAGWAACGAGLLVYTILKAEPAKKPLVYTARARRILTTTVCLGLVLLGVNLWLPLSLVQRDLTAPLAQGTALIILLAGLLITQLSPVLVFLANVLLTPVQTAINQTYLRQARRRLRAVHPLVVGITGSYGKTSTKYLLDQLLSGHRRVLKTPQSYNTLMGVCRTINNDLDDDCDVFIAEMGAYRPGDIKELCAFVQPTLGILTAIGPQHLERFKTIDSIQRTKYELIEALPSSGVAIFNNDDPRCRALADHTTQVPVMRYGLDTSAPALDVWAETMAMTPEGLSFTIADKQGQRVDVQTMLLGRHNILNILGASCAALALGMSIADLAKAIRTLPPVPHRLQIIDNGGGVTVIDDSYNANPIGALAALEVLGSFRTGQRILVTPGLVELGPLEAQLNEELGAQAAEVCDYIVLVGVERTKPLLVGLQRKNFPPDHIRVVRDLKAATLVIPTIVGVGDTVLFENDLPDQYA